MDRSTTKRRHIREKSVIDHVARDLFQPPPEPAAEKGDKPKPTTDTGLSVEEQVRKEWDPSRTLLVRHARTGSRHRLIPPPHRHDQHWATFTGRARRRVGVAEPEDSIALLPWRPRLAVANAGEKRDANRKIVGI